MDYKNTLIAGLCLAIIGGIFVFKYSFRSVDTTTAKKYTVLVQGSCNIPFISEIKSSITPMVNRVIKQELGLNIDDDIDFFIPKDVQRLTLYYVEDIYDNAEIANIILEAQNVVETNQHAFHLKQTGLSFDARFLGDEYDQLVIMADDHNQELATINALFKKPLHQLNAEYTSQHNRSLYNVEHSERYGYNPHVSLGKINLTFINKHIKNSQETDAILDRIRIRITEETLHIAKPLFNTESTHVSFDKIIIFDTRPGGIIKEVPLSK